MCEHVVVLVEMSNFMPSIMPLRAATTYLDVWGFHTSAGTCGLRCPYPSSFETTSTAWDGSGSRSVPCLRYGRLYMFERGPHTPHLRHTDAHL